MRPRKGGHLAWQLTVLQYPCFTCGAAPGAWCVTNTGHEMHEPHADRSRQASADKWTPPDDADDELPDGI